MNRRLLWSLLVLLLGVTPDSSKELPEAFARPEFTIARYWHSMLEHRHVAALECFADFHPRESSEMLRLPDLVELRCRDFRLTDRGRGVVDVLYTVEYRVSMTDSLNRFPSGDRLRLTRGGWKIQQPVFLARR
jgi:hypothetical protein